MAGDGVGISGIPGQAEFPLGDGPLRAVLVMANFDGYRRTLIQRWIDAAGLNLEWDTALLTIDQAMALLPVIWTERHPDVLVGFGGDVFRRLQDRHFVMFTHDVKHTEGRIATCWTYDPLVITKSKKREADWYRAASAVKRFLAEHGA